MLLRINSQYILSMFFLKQANLGISTSFLTYKQISWLQSKYTSYCFILHTWAFLVRGYDNVKV